MKVVVAGCRASRDPAHDIAVSELVHSELSRILGPMWGRVIILHGACPGVDLYADTWAAYARVPVHAFPADWSLGRRAGPLRNAQMAEAGDSLIAFWDGESRGTLNMISEMTKRGKPTRIISIARVGVTA